MTPPRPYIGGQAVIEGVMMRAPGCLSVAVRRPDGKLVVREGPLRAKLLRSPVSQVPLLRGVVMLFESISLGYGALRFAAEQQMTEEERAKSATAGGGAWLSLLVFLGLFMALPQGMTSGVANLLGVQWEVSSPTFHLVTGAFKLLVFATYLLSISLIDDIRRVFQYHGAEHKTIFAYEAGLPLTVENVRAQSTLHPRCGTTFLVIVVAVSIVAGSIVTPLVLGDLQGPLAWALTLLLRILLLPFVAATSYELQRASARFCTRGPLRLLLYPGFLFQKITTREPDDKQIEVAILAMEAARLRDEQAVPLSQDEPDRVHVLEEVGGLRGALAGPGGGA